MGLPSVPPKTTKLKVAVKADHLQRVSSSRNPVLALAELIWNGLDADATAVSVDVRRSLLGVIEEIQVVDNGDGITSDVLDDAFTNLGGSWKSRASHSRSLRRMLHGRAGKGRFRAFALGSTVTWTTVTETPKGLLMQEIRGQSDSMDEFVRTEPTPARDAKGKGTTVTIRDVDKDFDLESDAALDALGEELALYLRQYNDVRVTVAGRAVTPSSFVVREDSYELAPVATDDGRLIPASLLVVEWAKPTSRALFLCDPDGFSHHKVQPGIQAPSFQFTAHLRSPLVRDLAERNQLELEEMDPALNALVDAAREKLRDHFRQRVSEQAKGVVAQWQKRGVYPYTEAPKDNTERVERQVFDVVALNVNQYLPKFAESDDRSQKFQLTLLRQAIESSPDAARKIVSEVLNLPRDKQEELADLLERTPLSHVISAARVIADRVELLAGLETLLYHPEVKKRTLERSQLHKIVQQNTWLFGEEYNLLVSDRGLSQVLEQHRALLGHEGASSPDDPPVRLPDGSIAIVDLLLGFKQQIAGSQRREHLVIELKRPTVLADLDVINQVRRYATAVSQDQRFVHTGVVWRFVALTNDVAQEALTTVRQRDRPVGLVDDFQGEDTQVWIKTWSQVISENRARLEFFRQALNYEASDESSTAHLRKVYAKYIPDELFSDETVPRDEPATARRSRKREDATGVEDLSDASPRKSADNKK